MNESGNSPGSIDLRQVAAVTAVVTGVVAIAAVGYLLLDILMLLFLGIVVAAALQPWHVVLCRWGVPRGLAVLLIYFLFLIGLALIVIIVGPVLIEQIGVLASEVPRAYVNVRSYLQGSGTAPFHFLGQRLPQFESLTQALTQLAPQLYQGTVGLTTSIVRLPTYFVTVLVIGFYWTMEVPRLERLLLSLIAVEHRPRALNIWHEIESRLGGFIRGQGLAMLFIGAASGCAYALIGLPNALALAVLAGLLEAVPLIGPGLAIAPALLVALPLGAHTVLLVVVLAMVLQLIENNILFPRIMHRAVGVNALVGLLAVLAFGTLYGILGVLVAIPIAAVIQVLLDSMLVNAEAVAERTSVIGGPLDDLRSRIWALRHQARIRFRARTTRMGIDPATEDHVVDAVDQRIEAAVVRVEKLLLAAEETSDPLAVDAQMAIVEKLRGATGKIEQAVGRIGTIAAPGENAPAAHRAAAGLALGGTNLALERTEHAVEQVEASIAVTAQMLEGIEGVEAETITDNLDQATERFKETVRQVETFIVAAKDACAAEDAALIDNEDRDPIGTGPAVSPA